MSSDDHFARVVIGSEASEHVAITVFDTSSDLPADPYEQWLEIGIDIEVGAFSASYGGSFLVGDLRLFYDQLVTLHKSLSGQAALQPMEPWLNLVIAGNGRGNLTVTGEASDDFTRNKLKFTLPELDQTHLKTIVHDLDKILQNFPTRSAG